MLPSGNDAAHQLALHFGAKLLQLKLESESKDDLRTSTVGKPDKKKDKDKEGAKQMTQH